jgi:hypothetical protein
MAKAMMKPRTKAKWPKPAFVVSHTRDHDYKGGLRS